MYAIGLKFYDFFERAVVGDAEFYQPIANRQ